MKGPRVVVVGASGLVGREILTLLGERGFPLGDVLAFGSERSAGHDLEVGDAEVRVQRLPRELPPADVVFLSATPEISRDLAEDAADGGALVIDLTGAFEPGGETPVVRAGGPLPPGEGGAVVSAPGPVALVLAAVLAPLRPLGLRRVQATALVSASAFGDDAVEMLARASATLLGGLAVDEEDPAADTSRAFNAVPVPPADARMGVRRLTRELCELLGLEPGVGVGLRLVRTPTFHGQGLAVSAQVSRAVDEEELRTALRDAASVVIGESMGLRDAVGSDAVHVSDLRIDDTDPSWFHLWVASDNLRQGAAVNAVAVGETRLRRRTRTG